jgi:hypothetical protein
MNVNTMDRSSKAMRFDGGVFQWDHLGEVYRVGAPFEKRIVWSKVNEDGSLAVVTDPELHISLTTEWQRLDRVATRTRLLAKTA